MSDTAFLRHHLPRAIYFVLMACTVAVLAYKVDQFIVAVSGLQRSVDSLALQQARVNAALVAQNVTLQAAVAALRGPDRAAQVRVTAFSLTDAETGGRPNITSLGTKPVVGRTAAVHPALAAKFMNRTVFIPGHGTWHVTTLTSRNVPPNTLDLCKPEEEAAKFTPRKATAVAID